MSDRRRQSDRRDVRIRQRRRKGDQRIFAIELTAGELRIAELYRPADGGGDQITSAAAYPWRQEAASLHSPEGVDELTAALREVARTHAMHGAEIRLILGGEFYVLRTVRGAVEEVRAELQLLEQRSRLYLSLGPGEKVVVSQSRALDARHAHALAAVCNRATLEAIQVASEAAGLEIAVIEPALSALNRAVSRLPDVPVEPYLLINVNDAAFEVGVCHEGSLLLDYRPGGRAQADDLPALLEGHLTRLSRHVGRCLRRPPPEFTHVYLCGDGPAVQAASQQFREYSSLEVRRVRSEQVQATWQFREQEGVEASLASLGGLLASYLPPGQPDAPNLMQHLLDRKREPLRPRLLRCATPLAATLLAAFTLGLVNGGQQRQLDAMQIELGSLGAAEGRASELRLQTVAAEQKLAELKKLSDQLPSHVGGALIGQLAHCMPSDVWLNRLEIQDRRTVRLNGASYLEAGVYDFVRWLEQAPGLAEVALKRTNPSSAASGPTTSFELEVTLADIADLVTKVARHE